VPVVPQHDSLAEASQQVVCATGEQQALVSMIGSSAVPAATRARTAVLLGAAASSSASVTCAAAPSTSPEDPQPASPPVLVEHTPVSGRTSSTLRADSQSPTNAATTERTCSQPVSVRKVGARP
jgi:hypothetical protein